MDAIRLFTRLTPLHVALIVLWAALWTIPDHFMHPGTDYGVYFNGGRLVAQGDLPYRDFFDHKPPVIYYVLAIWQLAFGSSLLSARLALIPLYSFVGIGTYVFARTVFRSTVVGLASGLLTVALVLSLSQDPWRNGVIVVLAVAWELLSIALLVQMRYGKTGVGPLPRRYLPLAAGLLAVLAVLTRQTALTPVIVVGVWAAYDLKASRSLTWWRSATEFAVGFMAPIGVFLLLAIISGIGLSTVSRSWSSPWPFSPTTWTVPRRERPSCAGGVSP